ncbi:dephospho-CoA kinase [Kaistia geumhonensis]|uniref:Dephospho-CoA kinase n=1 Tax=Kaistia geumhonensis TaxID=410839 RepID=A0ABU0M882_9HYPH|nr:dephospho-CoA kinase [Kaistia geumhonensis]MCX5477769.1 dephospho-CoA kinase [Kaistia geumhonensis]MDQ0517020.1 dephospho-CoA kinase [Kaistia geumhonensis]
MITLGLTGSIGMGKSTTAAMFARRGVAVHDADAAVHRLYGRGGAAVAPVGALHPEAVAEGAVDRAVLASIVQRDRSRLAALEAIVHPLVREEETRFLAGARAAGRRIALVDVPLLLETGAERRVDAVIVVSAAPEIQHARVLGRPDMTEERFEAILARQMPDAEKRRRAHFIIDTGRGLAAAERAVADILTALAATAAGRAG